MSEQAHRTLIYAEEVFRIQGAVFEVYRRMGAGFLEAVYQECLGREFSFRGIPFKALQSLPLSYREETLKTSYIADFVVFDTIILELKAVRALAPEHRAQTINYLRSTGMRLGLLLNFSAVLRVAIERFAV